MIIGSKRIKKVILFDIANQYESNIYYDRVDSYLTYPAGFFQLQEQYQVSKIIFLDLIAGSFYVSSTPYKPITYDLEIKNHFLNYYTTEEKFESELNSLFQDLKSTSEVITNKPDREIILKEITEEIIEVCDKQYTINLLFNVRLSSGITFIALRFLSKFKKYLECVQKQTAHTTIADIERNYYYKNPHISSHQNPFAYFQYIVALGSLQEVHKQEWYQEHLDYSEGEDKSVLMDPFRTEFFKTKEFLDVRIKQLQQKERRKYVKEVVESIRKLIENSEYLSPFDDYINPYLNLIEWLKEEGYRVNINALKMPSSHDYVPLWDDEVLLSKLKNLTYRVGEDSFPLFINPINVEDLKLFLRGKLNRMEDTFVIGWTLQPTYYLIYRISHYEPSILLPSKIENNEGKKFKFENGKIFNRSSYDNTGYSIKKGLSLPGNSREIIDNFFSRK